MIIQKEFTLRPRPRGFHLITHEIESNLPNLPDAGLLHILIKHTSAGICLNENADPSVRVDLESFMNKLIPENHPVYTHTYEGDDDVSYLYYFNTYKLPFLYSDYQQLRTTCSHILNNCHLQKI